MFTIVMCINNMPSIIDSLANYMKLTQSQPISFFKVDYNVRTNYGLDTIEPFLKQPINFKNMSTYTTQTTQTTPIIPKRENKTKYMSIDDIKALKKKHETENK